MRMQISSYRIFYAGVCESESFVRHEIYLYEMTHIYIFNFNLQSKVYNLYGCVDVLVCYEFLLDAARVCHCVHRIHHDPPTAGGMAQLRIRTFSCHSTKIHTTKHLPCRACVCGADDVGCLGWILLCVILWIMLVITCFGNLPQCVYVCVYISANIAEVCYLFTL